MNKTTRHSATVVESESERESKEIKINHDYKTYNNKQES